MDRMAARLARNAVAAAAFVACLGAHATTLVVGNSYYLAYDISPPDDSFTDATLGTVFDTSVLSLVDVRVWSGAGVEASVSTYPQDFDFGPPTGTVSGFAFSVLGQAIHPNDATYPSTPRFLTDENSNSLTLLLGVTVNAMPAAGTTTDVWVVDATTSTGLPSSYYQLSPPQLATFDVSPIPEPATVASMLAGLAMLGAVVGRARRRSLT